MVISIIEWDFKKAVWLFHGYFKNIVVISRSSVVISKIEWLFQEYSGYFNIRVWLLHGYFNNIVFISRIEWLFKE